ncbi:phosphopantetheine adenylyltransferase [Paraburkholderia sediminicola]|uniref:Phosphopantetheine adenylyltransferase n=1 Tax=Paraburkholderia metrosideri TaxID=580937 RepID=A0ABW9DPD6_9BURK
MKYLIVVSLVFAGVIHLLPLSGALGASRLASLYGIAVEEPNLAVLMRHRAVLFGLLGAFLIYSAFNAAMQPVGFAAGAISICAFLWLAWSTGHLNMHLGRVVIVDVVALMLLILGACGRWWLVKSA